MFPVCSQFYIFDVSILSPIFMFCSWLGRYVFPCVPIFQVKLPCYFPTVLQAWRRRPRRRPCGGKKSTKKSTSKYGEVWWSLTNQNAGMVILLKFMLNGFEWTMERNMGCRSVAHIFWRRSGSKQEKRMKKTPRNYGDISWHFMVISSGISWIHLIASRRND